MPSKIWRRKNKDEALPRQRWYCRSWTGGYKTKLGTIIELRLYGEFFVAKAPIPFDSWHDIKASVVEAKARAEGTTFDTRQELFESLPVLRPLCANGSSLMRPAVVGEFYEGTYWGTDATAEDLKDCFKFNHADYEALPELAWETILAIYASAGETDHLVAAMQDLQEVDNP